MRVGARTVGTAPIGIGDKIREFRTARDMSCAKLAEAVGVYENTVNFWENGVSVPSRPLRQRVCDVLGVTEADLFGVPADPPKRATKKPRKEAVEPPVAEPEPERRGVIPRWEPHEAHRFIYPYHAPEARGAVGGGKMKGGRRWRKK